MGTFKSHFYQTGTNIFGSSNQKRDNHAVCFLMGALGTAGCSHLVLPKENGTLHPGILLDGFGVNAYIFYYKNT